MVLWGFDHDEDENCLVFGCKPYTPEIDQQTQGEPKGILNMDTQTKRNTGAGN